jgi:ribose transport system permease protein
MATQEKSRLLSRFSSLDRENRSVVISYAMILVLILFGTLFITPNFISPTFLTQQLRLASFAYLRVPSMVLTLGVNAVLKGITVVYTGSAPQFQQTPPLLSRAATEVLFGFLPVAVILWALVSLMHYLILSRSGLGRKTYAVGNNEIAAYLSGVRTPRVLVMVFVLSGALNALAGLLLAGNAGRSFNEMGDPFLLPAIAAVVVGGTSILGGSGKYIGTIAGVIIIRLLDGALNIVQVPPATKDITFGLVILVMLFLYGRGEKVRE